jgi:hypothetical protein
MNNGCFIFHIDKLSASFNIKRRIFHIILQNSVKKLFKSEYNLIISTK